MRHLPLARKEIRIPLEVCGSPPWGIFLNMEQIQIFNSPEFGVVRTIEGADGEPMFCLVDVCNALELDASQVVKRLQDGVVSIHPISDSLGREQRANFINEDGLYDVILDSRKKKARMFRKWVTSEVLPSIRKRGVYATPVTVDMMIADPDFAIELLTNLKEERNRRMEVEKQVTELTDKVNTLAPKAAYYDSILASPDSVVVTQIAKDYGMSPQEFNKRLNVLGIQYKVNGQWVLYAKYQGEGYTDSYTGIKRNSNGTWMSTVWTQRGRLFLYTMLKEWDILPVVERYPGYCLPSISKMREKVI